MSLVGPLFDLHVGSRANRHLGLVSPVASVFRQISTYLLCGIVAIGHAAAWWHVAHCDHGVDGAGRCERQTVRVSGAAALVAVADHGCRHHCCGRPDAAADTAAETSPTSNDPGGRSPDHDPDDCFVCQSLATPCGADTFDLPVVGWYSAEHVRPPSLPTPHLDLWCDLPVARGPPMRVG